MNIGRLTACLFITASLLCSAANGADEAATFREKGIAALKQSESNPEALIEGARCFAKAAELYATAGDDTKATEMNSFLYWCKKKMTLSDIEQFTKSGDVYTAKKLETVENLAPKADEAQKWLVRAEQYAKENPNEHYLVAIRFFEVASRFVGTKESIAAQERSLKEQGLSLANANTKTTPIPAKPAISPNSVKKRVNLLPMIDVTKDVVLGKWKPNGATLTGDKGLIDRIEIPYQPPDEYDFQIVFMRLDGEGVVSQILCKGHSQFMWCMEGWQPVASGLENIDGKRSNDNETTFRGPLIKNGTWHTSVVKVRNSEITVFFDGKPLTRLKPNYDKLTLSPDWKLRDNSVLGLGHTLGRIVFSTVEVIEITGTGKMTR